MKLVAGNPNLMRTNPNAGLAAVPNKLGDKNPAKYVRGDYVPRQRDEHEALPPQINVWTQPVYVPERVEPARRGANDFLQLKSKGT
jgi:hypothetical protein